mgnify:FL=1
MTPPERASGLHLAAWTALGLAAVVATSALFRLGSLSLTAEEYRWQEVARALSVDSLLGLFRHGKGTYRPLCGCALALCDRAALGTTARHAADALLHLANAALLAMLVKRWASWAAAAIAGGSPVE